MAYRNIPKYLPNVLDHGCVKLQFDVDLLTLVGKIRLN